MPLTANEKQEISDSMSVYEKIQASVCTIWYLTIGGWTNPPLALIYQRAFEEVLKE
jgi:hypothetical protein